MNLNSAETCRSFQRSGQTLQAAKLRWRKRRKSMARIAGVDLPRNKQARIALTYIYGIGNPRAASILSSANVDPFKKVQDLGEDEVNRIRQVIEKEGDVEGDARKDVSMNIKRLIDIQSYRGNRHRRNLPVRGQRSHTNARTRKGPRKGTIAGKKKATKT
jgi:small subunit ribosomal protein S13